MRIRHHPDTATAILLVAVVVLSAWLGNTFQHRSRPAAMHLLPAEGSSARAYLEWCRENVAIVHDLYWASACKVVADDERRKRRTCLEHTEPLQEPASAKACGLDAEPLDDSPDCTLPDDRARPLNEARAHAEQQCMDEATARDLRRNALSIR